jgi:hypothetical protein
MRVPIKLKAGNAVVSGENITGKKERLGILGEL